jgi:tetratricopeptide (TPR) repeat protein
MEGLDKAVSLHLPESERDVLSLVPRVVKYLETTVSDGEVHAMRAMLFENGPGSPEEIKREVPVELGEALRREPANLSARRLQWSKSPKTEHLKLAREMTELHPKDWRAWDALALSLPMDDKAGRESALRKAVEHGPDASHANNNLAWELVQSGRADEALTFANRAARLAPWDPMILDTYAVVAASLGRCAFAAKIQKRAISVIPHGAPASAYREISDRLHEIEQRCVPR